MTPFWSFVLYILFGALAGFIAGKIMKGGGFGFILNCIVGIAGSVIGGWLMSLLDIGGTGGIIAQLVVAIIGACLLIWVISFFKKK